MASVNSMNMDEILLNNQDRSKGPSDFVFAGFGNMNPDKNNFLEVGTDKNERQAFLYNQTTDRSAAIGGLKRAVSGVGGNWNTPTDQNGNDMDTSKEIEQEKLIKESGGNSRRNSDEDLNYRRQIELKNGQPVRNSRNQ
jgi:hypothetical protein